MPAKNSNFNVPLSNLRDHVTALYDNHEIDDKMYQMFLTGITNLEKLCIVEYTGNVKNICNFSAFTGACELDSAYLHIEHLKQVFRVNNKILKNDNFRYGVGFNEIQSILDELIDNFYYFGMYENMGLVQIKFLTQEDFLLAKIAGVFEKLGVQNQV